MCSKCCQPHVSPQPWNRPTILLTDHYRSLPTSRISYQDFCVVLACANDWSLLLARNACAHACFQGPGPGPERCLCTSASPGAERDAFSNFRLFEQLRSTGFHHIFVHLKRSLAASVCDLKILSRSVPRWTGCSCWCRTRMAHGCHVSTQCSRHNNCSPGLTKFACFAPRLLEIFRHSLHDTTHPRGTSQAVKWETKYKVQFEIWTLRIKLSHQSSTTISRLLAPSSSSYPVL